MTYNIIIIISITLTLCGYFLYIFGRNNRKLRMAIYILFFCVSCIFALGITSSFFSTQNSYSPFPQIPYTTPQVTNEVPNITESPKPVDDVNNQNEQKRNKTIFVVWTIIPILIISLFVISDKQKSQYIS